MLHIQLNIREPLEHPLEPITISVKCVIKKNDVANIFIAYIYPLCSIASPFNKGCLIFRR